MTEQRNAADDTGSFIFFIEELYHGRKINAHLHADFFRVEPDPAFHHKNPSMTLLKLNLSSRPGRRKTKNTTKRGEGEDSVLMEDEQPPASFDVLVVK